MAFVLVQHMDPSHVSLLNQLLERDTSMPVFQVKNGMAVEPNCVYVIPPNTEMTIDKGKLRLLARPGGALRHTPIDSFLSALAEDQQALAIGVILSGIGSDGTKGLLSIKAQGGISFAQDEDSAKYPGMPQSAVAAGCVDLVLPPDKIARELARMRRHPYLELAQQPEATELPASEDGQLRRIFRLMRQATGVDFTHYKQRTIQRRISRRMMVRQCDTLTRYAKYVEEHPDELRALFQDVLIHVTSFFREREVFKSLHSMVFPRIVPNLAPGEFARLWVPGCSSGEEVYSIAITLQEFLGEASLQVGVQIFGTDISDLNIQRARAGIYTDSSVEGVSPERLRRFFVKMEGGYQVAKAIREMCIFARHDLTRDPPFARMDLISCRNVLIYLTPGLQRKVLSFLHYALKPNGFLILAKSEGASAAANLFAVEDRKASIYSKIATAVAPPPEFRLGEYERASLGGPLPPRKTPPFDLRKEAERIVLERYAPPTLVVDSEMRIINFQGDTSPFLRPAAGEASFEFLRLVRPELILETRSAIQEAKKQGVPARRESVPYKRNGQICHTDVEVVPIPGRTRKGVDFLVLFQAPRPSLAAKGAGPAKRKSGPSAEAGEAERLKQQLASSQEHLRSLMQDQEAAAEELRAANEEILSSNEELQSTNEELQTAREELPSSNEELSTLNEELQHRNVELAQTAVDLNSLLKAVEIPMVILGPDRSIRRFSPGAEQLLNLITTDVGRPIGQIRTNLINADLDEMASEVLERRVTVEHEVRDQKGHWYALRMRPYKTFEDHVEGIIAVLVDIHDLKQYSTAIVDTIRGCLLVLDSHYRVLLASPAFYRTFKVEKEETEGKLLWELSDGQWNIPPLRELLEKVLVEKKHVLDFEVQHDFPAIGRKFMLLDALELQHADSGSRKVLLVIEDITERRAAEERIHQLLARVMTAAEDEGKRLSRELHDSLGPRLARLNLEVSEVERRVSSRPDLVEPLAQIGKEISEVAKATHDLSHELHPAAVSQLSLAAALEGECAAFSKLHGISVNLSAESVPEPLSEAVAFCLYRVAQEALENIRKHAQAKAVSVTLAGRGHEVVLAIRDFGKGFGTHAARAGHGLGLVSMEERVRLVNGRLSVNSKSGEGTQVEVRIPLGANA
jgi:two-component system CheB/CheR fusion protein